MNRRIGRSTEIEPSHIFNEFDWWRLAVSAPTLEVVPVRWADKCIRYRSFDAITSLYVMYSIQSVARMVQSVFVF
jgi:hypothetical protein